MDKVERQRTHFNRIAARYQAARRDRNHQTLKQLIWADVAAALELQPQQGYRLLEAMCGYAEASGLLEAASGARFDFAGFDYSDAVLSELRTRKPALSVWHQDATRFESAPCYDLVLLIGGLHHVPDRAPEVVRRLAGALKPGGFLVNFEPTAGNPLAKWVRQGIYRRNDLFDAETERAFDLDELLAMFKAADLTAHRIFFPGLISYILYYNPDAFPALNFGGERMVRATYAVDRLMMRNRIGRFLSFATFSIWRKPQ